MPPSSRLLALAAVTLAAACGGSGNSSTSTLGETGGGGAQATSSSVATTGGGGAGGAGGAGGGTGGVGGEPSDVYPAPHPAAPQIQNLGGPILAQPHVVPIFFPGDDPLLAGEIVDFLGKVGSTAYWAAITTEYGVGALTMDPVVQLTEAAPAATDLDGIDAWLAGKLNGDDPALPAPAGDVIYAIHYPASTVITANFGGAPAKACTSFGGYHYNTTLDAAHGQREVAYLVMPRCDGFDGLSGIDAATAAESHELVEAVTDPFVNTHPAFAYPDDDDLSWYDALGAGEVGDMCASNLDSFTIFPELPYTVQRSWSNAAAQAGHEPCVPPLEGEVYFNSVPVLGDHVKYEIQGQTFMVRGVKVPVGSSRTIDLDLFSDGAYAPWGVVVQEARTANLDLELGYAYGQNGQKLHLTITALSPGQSSFIVYSYPNAGPTTQPNVWVGFVNN
jgi:hypothetical protein